MYLWFFPGYLCLLKNVVWMMCVMKRRSTKGRFLFSRKESEKGILGTKDPLNVTFRKSNGSQIINIYTIFIFIDNNVFLIAWFWTRMFCTLSVSNLLSEVCKDFLSGKIFWEQASTDWIKGSGFSSSSPFEKTYFSTSFVWLNNKLLIYHFMLRIATRYSINCFCVLPAWLLFVFRLSFDFWRNYLKICTTTPLDLCNPICAECSE